ncbi:peptide chain release factor PrfB2, chloroplastic-like [Magnolia sinica]|uniref:peptide chain release factor PrfB2, chloroplastic-like n=1 Tax=Magnolia sinica TaxID=86752 RepID=UPI00265B5E07|nr:peptide chain release factor PrfB2, chloroplastic-like [Magnolia sinica]
MGFFLLRKSIPRIPSFLPRNFRIPILFLSSPPLSTPHSYSQPPHSDSHRKIQSDVTISQTPSKTLQIRKIPSSSHQSPGIRSFGSQAISELRTSDGLTVDDIVARSWPILDENESDWKSHSAAIAQSIQLIKKRLQWRKMILRVEQLSAQLNKSDLWDDPVYAGRVSREHGMYMGKMKEVNGFEQELLDHIDMLKLAREENDRELESDSMKALLRMRRIVKEKELEALLAGDRDSCSCFIEVISFSPCCCNLFKCRKEQIEVSFPQFQSWFLYCTFSTSHLQI